jgi:hypothetical protein
VHAWKSIFNPEPISVLGCTYVGYLSKVQDPAKPQDLVCHVGGYLYVGSRWQKSGQNIYETFSSLQSDQMSLVKNRPNAAQPIFIKIIHTLLLP